MSRNKAPSIDMEVGILPFKSNKAFYMCSFALFCSWLTFCWQGLSSVVQIWYGNEIFNHGFFIVPGAVYLIYLKRNELLSVSFCTTPLAFIVIIPALLLYVVGIAGEIQLFLHAATFALLPALIWLILGTQATKTIIFPLVFMLFSIPIGEQLIPYLQEIAADGSVALLSLSGIPLFRSGLYIEIPQGRFLVAEACSGVSFFIASLVIGSLYAYLNLASVGRRVSFIIISLIFPVVANIIRVYGIILIAYMTDMEHAAGADHLIYGWFFFAFVIICLLGIGELMRTSIPDNYSELRKSGKTVVKFDYIIVIVLIMLSATFWVSSIQDDDDGGALQALNYDDLRAESCPISLWRPVLNQPDKELTFALKETDCEVIVHTAWFGEQGNELISDLHRAYDPEKYSLVTKDELLIGDHLFTTSLIVSVTGESRVIATWYVVNQTIFVSKTFTKIEQIKMKLLGLKNGGQVWYVSAPVSEMASMEKALKLLIEQ
jgi:exosortase A